MRSSLPLPLPSPRFLHMLPSSIFSRYPSIPPFLHFLPLSCSLSPPLSVSCPRLPHRLISSHLVLLRIVAQHSMLHLFSSTSRFLHTQNLSLQCKALSSHLFCCTRLT
ncbi:hypothetical protein BCV69DRAFT_217167 [Microstroma glucosiphilum]|uniref:Uncharacterized protein n=1 Tax=Pseudomicrostroma glucosiphilum TaxID=1684307 RepID=A0A316U4D5_9BASI|nr:hypothetical protein BCV69DRAFT_217167 [Pseudomicrostroma glucosiphilum]PWN20040.1 hypothetical protein BCV69DRAFT_217167 [Pseudomicrostroma glucosiphilum]